MTMMLLLLLEGHVFTCANLHKNICYNTQRQHKPSVTFFPVHLTGFFSPHVVEQTSRIMSRVIHCLPVLCQPIVLFFKINCGTQSSTNAHSTFLVHWSYVFFVCVFFFPLCFFCAAHLLVHGLRCDSYSGVQLPFMATSLNV